MEHQYTITLGELERAFRSSNSTFLCNVVFGMFCEGVIDYIPEAYTIDVIKVFQREFPDYVSSSLIESDWCSFDEITINGFIINPDIRRLKSRELRTRILTDLVGKYSGDHLLTFTITI